MESNAVTSLPYIVIDFHVFTDKDLHQLQQRLEQKYAEGYGVFSHHAFLDSGHLVHVFLLELRKAE